MSLSSPLSSNGNGYPENPLQVRVWRGERVESVHRGTWVLVDPDGAVLAGSGAYAEPMYARSSVKAFQALPLLASGAAERFEFTSEELALALASHNAEAVHTLTVQATLKRLGLGVEHLQCGPQVPGDPRVRFELRAAGVEPSALHNNCSGKHAGFLALALHLGVPVERYLDPGTESQVAVRHALAELAGLAPDDLSLAVDGCSAPTWRLPLVNLARAFARLANPDGLGAERAAQCRRLTDVAAAHPNLIAGDHRRLCTDLARATGGRLFPKVGAEAVYAVGEVGGGRGLAVKLDDGGPRGLHALVMALLRRFDMLRPDELDALSSWAEPRLRNHAGLEVGRLEVPLP
jgi:L-asparaginase II